MSMDHAEAIRGQAAERYQLGELDAEQRERFEEHFFDCAECAESVRVGAAFEEQSRAAFRREDALALRARPAAWSRALWPVAATLFAGLLAHQSFVVLPRLRGELERAEGLQAAPWYFLSVSRAEPQVLLLEPGQRMLGLTLSRSSERSFAHYRCELRDQKGNLRQSALVPAPPQGDELQLLLPVARLEPGSYVVSVSGLDTPNGPVAAPDLARYHFSLRPREK